MSKGDIQDQYISMCNFTTAILWVPLSRLKLYKLDMLSQTGFVPGGIDKIKYTPKTIVVSVR